MLIERNGRAAGGRLIALCITAVMTLVSFDAMASIVVNTDVAVRSKLLRYDATVLDNPAEAQKLYRRLRLAAKQVCKRPADEVSNGQAANACEKQAVTEAVVGVNNVSLTAIHRARMGGEQPVYRAWLTAPTPCAQCG